MRPAPVVFGLLLSGSALAAEAYPQEVATYIERRELCEHFRQEPWPEGASAEDRQRREFIASQWDRYCRGSDQALRELKRKYKANQAVMDRLESYETDIEGPQ